MDHLISAREPDLVIVTPIHKKENLPNRVGFAVQADHWVKLKKSEKKNKKLDLARELKKTLENESDGDTNCNWCTRYSHQRIGTGTGGLVNKRMSGDHLNYSIVEISQNTKKRFGDLKRLVRIQRKTIR